jgi:hypothetical protein
LPERWSERAAFGCLSKNLRFLIPFT